MANTKKLLLIAVNQKEEEGINRGIIFNPKAVFVHQDAQWWHEDFFQDADILTMFCIQTELRTDELVAKLNLTSESAITQIIHLFSIPSENLPWLEEELLKIKHA